MDFYKFEEFENYDLDEDLLEKINLHLKKHNSDLYLDKFRDMLIYLNSRKLESSIADFSISHFNKDNFLSLLNKIDTKDDDYYLEYFCGLENIDTSTIGDYFYHSGYEDVKYSIKCLRDFVDVGRSIIDRKHKIEKFLE